MVKKTVIMVMILTLFSKGLGFIREIILAYFYGTSSISDVFLVSMMIPTFIFGFIGAGIFSSYIPMYSKIESKYSISEATKFTNNLINMLFVFSTVIFIVCFIFTEPLVRLFASGFERKSLELTVLFTRITLAVVCFTAPISLFSGYLQLKGNQIIPGIMGLPLNLFLIAAMIISSFTSIYILPIGLVIATFAQLILLLLFVYKQGFNYKPILNFKDPHLKTIIGLSFPVLIGSSVDQVNRLVDNMIASYVVVGGISALNYANQLTLFVQGVFVISIVVVLYPIISKMAATDNIVGLKKTLSQTIIVIMVLLIPITVGTMLLAETIVDLLFGRGAFDYQAIDMTSTALFFYSIGMLGYGLKLILTQVFYSLQDTKTPMINAVWAVLLNIVLSIILSKYFGIGGIALATSISAIVCTILLFISLGKKIGYFKIKKIITAFVKSVVASIVMGIIVYFIYEWLSSKFNITLSLFISIVSAVCIYIVLICFMKIEEVDQFILELKRKKG